jgi:Protein of unknown function (DUF3592)
MEKVATAALSLLIGLVGLWTGFRQLKNRRELDRWPATPGRVVERGTFVPKNVGGGSPAFRYAPLVRYAYTVGGTEFAGDSINPRRIQLPTTGSKPWAEKRAASFADGVAVRYNPEDPAESFLVQTPRAKLYMVIAGSCFALLLGALFCLAK